GRIVHLLARREARRLVDRLVVGEDRVLLVGRELAPRLGVAGRRCRTLVDQQQVPHRLPPCWGWSPMRRTGTGEIDSSSATTTRAPRSGCRASSARPR